MTTLFVGSGETQPPRITALSPADGAAGVAPNATVQITFDEQVQRGTGSIELRIGSAIGALVESFDAATSNRLSINSNRLTLTPTAFLASGTNFTLVIPSGAVKDLAGNAYAGTATYDFRTSDQADTTAPTMVSFDPANGAAAVAIDAVLKLGFSEAIQRGSGILTLRSGSATGPIVESFDAASSSRLVLSGSALTIDPTVNLLHNTSYFLVVPAGAFIDLSGNGAPGTTVPGTYSFKTSTDATAPTVSSLSPLGGATSVAFDANLSLTFSEAIQRGAGFIELRVDSATGTLVESFDVATSQRMSVSGATLTVDPSADLSSGTRYVLVIPPDALKDMAGNPFVGLNAGGTTATYQFTTSTDRSAPVLSSRSPADGTTSASVGASLVLTFNETVRRGIGRIELRSGDELVEAFDAATSTRISRNDRTITLDPTLDLAHSKTYFLVVPGGAVRDLAGNAFAGTPATDPDLYDFRTVADTTAPTLMTRSPADGATSVPVGSSMTLTFSEPIQLGTGTITLRSGSASGPLVESFDAASGDRLLIAGTAITLKPSVELDDGTLYFLVIPSGVIRDLTGNAYPGTSSYDFTTVDTTAPTLTTRSPADDSGSVAIDSNILLSFSEPVLPGTGTIELRSGSATGAIVASFDAATAPSSQLAISGSTLTLNPPANLAYGSRYVLVMPQGAFKDAAGNGVAGSDSYDFLTVAAPVAGAPALYLDYRQDPMSGAMVLTPLRPQGLRAGTTVTYLWQSSATGTAWTTIANENRATYDPSSLPPGTQVRVQVSYGGTTTGTVTSVASTEAHRTFGDEPSYFTLSSTLKEDVALSAAAVVGAPALSLLETVWYRLPADGSAPIPIATGSTAAAATYTPGDADAGAALRVALRYSAGAGLSRTVFLDTPGFIEPVDDPTQSTLALVGELKQGQTLTLTGAIRDDDLLGLMKVGDERLRVVWQAADPVQQSEAGPVQPPPYEDLPVAAPGLSLLLGEEHVGRLIRVQVAYDDPGKSLASVDLLVGGSATVANVNDPPVGAIEISGEPSQGQELTASGWLVTDPDNLSPENPAGDILPSDWRWRWFSVDPSDASRSVLFGEADKVLLGQQQVGRLIRVEGSYLDARGELNSLSTLYLDWEGKPLAVADVPDEPQGGFRILLRDPLTGLEVNGDWEEGQTLMLVDTVTDPDGIPLAGAGSKQYQWLLNGNEIAGGTGSSLLLTQDLLGNWDPSRPGSWGDAVISARVSFADLSGPPDAPAVQVEAVNPGVIRNRNDLPTGTIGLKFERAEPSPHALVEGDQLTLDAEGIVDLDGFDSFDPWNYPVQWRWLLDGVSYREGASGPQWNEPHLVLTQDMIGKALSVEASYIDGFGALERVSRSLGTIVNRPDPAEGRVGFDVIHDGTDAGLRQGATLAARHEIQDPDGMPADTAIDWSWRAVQSESSWIEIGTGSTLTLTQDHVGQVIELVASFVDLQGGAHQLSSEWSLPVDNRPDPPDLSRIRIEGSFDQGGSLRLVGHLTDLDLKTSTNPDGRLMVGDPGLIIEWLAWSSPNKPPLEVAGPELSLTQDLVGQRIQARISYNDAFGDVTTRSIDSANPGETVRDVNDQPTADSTFQIVGEPLQNELLTVDVYLVDPDDAPGIVRTIQHLSNWQWFFDPDPTRIDDDQAIAGEVKETFRLTQAHVNQRIKVKASYIDQGGFKNIVFSPTIGPVQDVDDSAVGSLRILGDFVEGQTLRLEDTITDPDGISASRGKRYVWYLDGEPIQEGDGLTLTLTQVHVGAEWDGKPDQRGTRLVGAAVQFTDGFGTFNEIAAEGESRVANRNDPPSLFLVSGQSIADRSTEGDSLSVELESIIDPDGPLPREVTLSWLVGGTEYLVNARPWRDSSLVLGREMIGQALQIRARFVDAFGTVEAIVRDMGFIQNRPDPAEGDVSIHWADEPGLTQGARLTAGHDLVDPDGPASLPVQWRWWARHGEGPRLKIGEGPSITMTQAQVGARIQLEAHYVDGFGAQESHLSDWSPQVADVDDDPVPSLAIEGAPRVGQRLALTGAVADLDSETPGSPGGLLPLAALKDFEISWQSRAPGAEPSDFQAFQSDSDAQIVPGPDLLGHQLRAQISWTDGGGFRETITTEAIGPVLPELAILAGQIYQWRSHALMAHVEVSLEPLHAGDPEHPDTPALSPLTTSADGRFNFEGLALGAYQLTASRPVSAGELTAAITTADAMAALKLSLGRNPNPDPDGPGPLQPVPVSPYQWIAADLDGDGRVDRSDAQAILRIATGQSDPRAGWSFIAEGEDFLIEQGLDGPVFERPSAEVSRAAPVELELGTEGVFHAPRMGDAALEGYAFPSANLVGVLRGDVDGSWAWSGSGDGGTAVFLPPSYFTGLAALVPGIDIVHPAQFWVF